MLQRPTPRASGLISYPGEGLKRPEASLQIVVFGNRIAQLILALVQSASAPKGIHNLQSSK